MPVDLSGLADGAIAWGPPARAQWTELDVDKASHTDLATRLNWTGAFVGYTDYAVNDLVTHAGNLYRAICAHTSGPSAPATNGDPTYWERLAGTASVTLDSIPAGSVLAVHKTSGVWPGGTSSTGVRPTSRADVTVIWHGAAPMPAIVTSGTGGMLQGVDLAFVVA